MVEIPNILGVSPIYQNYLNRHDQNIEKFQRYSMQVIGYDKLTIL